MDAKDVRLYNWLFDVKFNKPIQFTSFYGLNNLVSKPNDFNPIPLTEEILLKNNFTKKENGIFYFDDTFQLEIDAMGYFWYKTNETHSIEIPYVHSLQNIFYTNVGIEKELQIK